MDKESFRDVIRQEIEWCENNMAPEPEENRIFQRGFIAGLRQARLLHDKSFDQTDISHINITP